MIEGGGHCGGHLAQWLRPGRVVDEVIPRDHVVATKKPKADQGAAFAELECLLGGRGALRLERLAESLHDGGNGAFRERQGLAADHEGELAVRGGQLGEDELSGLAGMLVEGDRGGRQGPWTAPRSIFEPRDTFQKSAAGAPSDFPAPRHGEPGFVCGTPVAVSSWQSVFT